MKIYLKLCLKMFLGMGIPVSLIFLGFLWLCQHEFGELVGAGLFYALFFSLIRSLFHIRRVRRITSGKYNEKDVLNVYHIRNIELQLPYDRTFDLCVLSLNLIEKRKIQNEDRSQGKIEARNGMLLGRNVVSFNVNKMDDNRTQVEVLSKPVFRPTLIDFENRNLDNVTKIIEFLKKR